MNRSLTFLLLLLCSAPAFTQWGERPRLDFLAPKEIKESISNLYRHRLYAKTIEAGSQALKRYPADPNISRSVAYSYMFTGTWDRNSAILFPFFSEFDTPEHARLIALSQALGGTKVATAQRLFEVSEAARSTMGNEYLEVHKDGASEAVYWLIILSEGRSDPERSLFLDKAVSIAPKDTFVQELVGLAKREKHLYKEATAAFRSALNGASKERKNRLAEELKKTEKQRLEHEKNTAVSTGKPPPTP